MAAAKLMDFDKALEMFEPVLGFEVHVELNTNTKMFSDAPNPANEAYHAAEPNTLIAPVDLGLPGSLPVVNETAIRSSISLGLALGCSIAESSRFARKNYFYPDLGKNYQISQYDEPIAFEGSVEVELEDGTMVTIPIERAHMEEDAGKLTHMGGSTGRIQGAEYSLVDYNRAGVPLVEIVTKTIFGTDHRAPEVAKAYVAAIRDIVRGLGISEARLERGNLRCDANVSLRPRGEEKLGTRTETKNVNSMRSVERAVRYEIQRQAQILADGGTITQETRHWHEDTGTTSPGRPKSDADDYRYFPEPDLLPVQPPRELIEELRAALPEQPVARRRRLMDEWGFTPLEFQDVRNGGLLDVVEATIAAGATPAAARKWWTGEITRLANAQEKDAVDLVRPESVAALQQLVDAGTLTDKLARQVLEGVIAGEGTPQEVVDARGLAVVSDDGALIAAIDEALAAQPDVMAKIQDGKVQAAGAIIGAVMKAMKGQADAARVRELILERAAQ
ncbi:MULTISPECIES: Asp-tRNA(Asn)/Glu-tRNA(Gln) amidotransferase subunit GatB [unclassified Microbacterium]|uniref:Asp-tRNA(Asn)/Glu-tRNA(Gln) amidotransferase subunit GatB n=1 Tax=unclassified Microbacterium TaxID=2609290 RepID=UPI0024691CEC|nr:MULTISPECIES: Asp-tRNA(Asn)/Glu-tRNA(Gln) amidotransferase subunit GatB [unclassified Microbacterium]MDH5133616.1 Asp-tRNA(Asn)/Glu-tRNA(Gln) amidotransferase subunit GatB [Microbacterium sp. RD10]MDH5137889.1 Asp-tRNA(Asn)/Glu-tRNA(Gln) amidotransferase subunit GatB [Microbacterium sp. RD11]MDH5145541.1 Asp-tRNA(Asn)/Glu-tRNA(Gln) amidotransferase subunit GatB [Microbacterium sp. RD12]MDH5156127.1 Asp-tRNA(Asn)/Glu-tRNA(Gln) amidotransferase subunit GatB [Microbacterium sp. RD06]MDH5166385